MQLLADVPRPRTGPVAAPAVQAQRLSHQAAANAACISGGLGLLPGPLGLISIIPDLLAVWQVQRQMVADIAGLYGKGAFLSPQTMLMCLFRHSAAQVVRDAVVRAGEKWLVRRASVKAMQGALERAGLKVTQRALGRGVSRFLPGLGAAAVGAYAAWDTMQVARTAIDIFRRDIISEDQA